MIVQASVLVVPKPDAMSRPGRSRKQRRRCSAVQIVNNVVLIRPNLARHLQTRSSAPPPERDHVVYVLEAVEHRSDPIFEENIDASLRKEATQCEKGGSGKDRITN